MFIWIEICLLSLEHNGVHKLLMSVQLSLWVLQAVLDFAVYITELHLKSDGSSIIWQRGPDAWCDAFRWICRWFRLQKSEMIDGIAHLVTSDIWCLTLGSGSRDGGDVLFLLWHLGVHCSCIHPSLRGWKREMPLTAGLCAFNLYDFTPYPLTTLNVHARTRTHLLHQK